MEKAQAVEPEEQPVQVEEEQNSEIEPKHNRTMTLHDFLREALNITTNNPGLGERELVSRVW